MGLLAILLTAILFALKLMGVIAVSWLVVALPAVLYAGLVFAILFVAAFVALWLSRD